MNSKKSAKDLAFEKERAKYRKQIRELEHELKKIKIEKMKLKEQLTEVEQENNGLKDWIERLLEYTELSEEDMKKMIQRDKTNAEFVSKMGDLGSFFDKILFRTY